MVPKDKAIKRFIVRNMVDASAIRDLQDACAIDGGCCPRLLHLWGAGWFQAALAFTGFWEQEWHTLMLIAGHGLVYSDSAGEANWRPLQLA